MKVIANIVEKGSKILMYNSTRGSISVFNKEILDYINFLSSRSEVNLDCDETLSFLLSNEFVATNSIEVFNKKIKSYEKNCVIYISIDRIENISKIETDLENMFSELNTNNIFCVMLDVNNSNDISAELLYGLFKKITFFCEKIKIRLSGCQVLKDINWNWLRQCNDVYIKYDGKELPVEVSEICKNWNVTIELKVLDLSESEVINAVLFFKENEIKYFFDFFISSFEKRKEERIDVQKIGQWFSILENKDIIKDICYALIKIPSNYCYETKKCNEKSNVYLIEFKDYKDCKCESKCKSCDYITMCNYSCCINDYKNCSIFSMISEFLFKE